MKLIFKVFQLFIKKNQNKENDGNTFQTRFRNRPYTFAYRECEYARMYLCPCWGLSLFQDISLLSTKTCDTRSLVILPYPRTSLPILLAEWGKLWSVLNLDCDWIHQTRLSSYLNPFQRCWTHNIILKQTITVFQVEGN